MPAVHHLAFWSHHSPRPHRVVWWTSVATDHSITPRSSKEVQGECATDRPRHQKRAVRCSRRQSRLAAHVLKTCEPRCTQVCEHPYPSFGLGDLPVLRSMRCRSLSRVRLSASRSAGDSVEVRSGVVGMRLVCHDLDWHAHRARHENCTDCTMNSKALPPPFPERAKQDLVQGPRGPSESESRKTNAFAPTASVQDSRELSARAVGDELRRIVALTIQRQARSPSHDVHDKPAFRSLPLAAARVPRSYSAPCSLHGCSPADGA